MKLTHTLFFALGAFAFIGLGSPAHAEDCGFPPGEPPEVPDGATASDAEMQRAIREIQDFGFEVQNYLNCMELNRSDFFINMTEAQRSRWTDDFNQLADELEERETELNEQIRIFNRRNS